MLSIIISILLFLIFLFLGSLHIYWGLGGKWASEGVLHVKDDAIKPQIPGLIPCLVVALGLFSFGIFFLVYVNLIPIHFPQPLENIVIGFTFVIFFLRSVGEFRYVGFFKTIKNTTFAKKDSKYYSPLCFLIAILIVCLFFLK